MSNPAADKVIDSNMSLRWLAPLFPDRIAAYHYYARTMALRHGEADCLCGMCRRHCDTAPMRFTWRANLHTAKTVLISFLLSAFTLLFHHLHTRCVVVRFTTVHRLCRDCRSRLRRRRIAVVLFHNLLFAALILALIVVMLLLFAVVASFWTREIRVVILAAFLGSLLVLGLVVWGFELNRRWLIPYYIRAIGRFPFFLEGVSEPG
jgi:hypothetical protein